jgi:hypothetical protein
VSRKILLNGVSLDTVTSTAIFRLKNMALRICTRLGVVMAQLMCRHRISLGCLNNKLNAIKLIQSGGSGSSIGIATGYGLDGPGIESRWGEIFRNWPDRPWGPRSLLYNRYPVFQGVRKRPGRDADPSPPSSAEV